MNDLISRQDAIRKYCYESCGCDTECGTEGCPMTFDRDGAEECYFIRFLKELPSAEPTQTNTPNTLESLDCISRQAAIDALDKHCNIVCQYSKKQRSVMCGACPLGTAFDVIENLPSDESVRHGKWIWVDGVRCSQCNYKLQTTGLPSYCPNCGSRMEE